MTAEAKEMLRGIAEKYAIPYRTRSEFEQDIETYANTRAVQIAEKAVGDCPCSTCRGIISRIKNETGES